MDNIKAFHSQLMTIYDGKPPVSKAKMSLITKTALKSIKYYKHVVLTVEKFINKAPSEYKLAALYVIDSIVRQSKYQFGNKDLFAPRFAKNLYETFRSIFKCTPEDKSKVIRVLNLWQKNATFSTDVIQPILDLANPKLNDIKVETEAGKHIPKNPQKECAEEALKVVTDLLNKCGKDPSTIGINPQHYQQLEFIGEYLKQQLDMSKRAAETDIAISVDAKVVTQLKELAAQLYGKVKPADSTGQIATGAQNSTELIPGFNKKILDFDYDDDDDEVQLLSNSSTTHINNQQQQQPADNIAQTAQNILTNPDIMKHLQQHMSNNLNQSNINPNDQANLSAEQIKKRILEQQQEEFDMQINQSSGFFKGSSASGIPGLSPPVFNNSANNNNNNASMSQPVAPPPFLLLQQRLNLQQQQQNAQPFNPNQQPPNMFVGNQPTFPYMNSNNANISSQLQPPQPYPSFNPQMTGPSFGMNPSFSDIQMAQANNNLKRKTPPPPSHPSNDQNYKNAPSNNDYDSYKSNERFVKRRDEDAYENDRSDRRHNKDRDRDRDRDRTDRDKDRKKSSRDDEKSHDKKDKDRDRDRSRDSKQHGSSSAKKSTGSSSRRDRDRDYHKDDKSHKSPSRSSKKDTSSSTRHSHHLSADDTDKTVNALSVLSRTIWIGHVPKQATEDDLKQAFDNYALVPEAINMVPPRGCAYVCFKSRADAAKVLDKMKDRYKLLGKTLQMDWSPFKGLMENTDYKLYWNISRGAYLIPYDKVDVTKCDKFNEGGTIDWDTVPKDLKQKMEEHLASTAFRGPPPPLLGNPPQINPPGAFPLHHSAGQQPSLISVVVGGNASLPGGQLQPQPTVLGGIPTKFPTGAPPPPPYVLDSTRQLIQGPAGQQQQPPPRLIGLPPTGPDGIPRFNIPPPPFGVPPPPIGGAANFAQQQQQAGSFNPMLRPPPANFFPPMGMPPPGFMGGLQRFPGGPPPFGTHHHPHHQPFSARQQHNVAGRIINFNNNAAQRFKGNPLWQAAPAHFDTKGANYSDSNQRSQQPRYDRDNNYSNDRFDRGNNDKYGGQRRPSKWDREDNTEEKAPRNYDFDRTRVPDTQTVKPDQKSAVESSSGEEEESENEDVANVNPAHLPTHMFLQSFLNPAKSKKKKKKTKDPSTSDTNNPKSTNNDINNKENVLTSITSHQAISTRNAKPSSDDSVRRHFGEPKIETFELDEGSDESERENASGTTFIPSLAFLTHIKGATSGPPPSKGRSEKANKTLNVAEGSLRSSKYTENKAHAQTNNDDKETEDSSEKMSASNLEDRVHFGNRELNDDAKPFTDDVTPPRENLSPVESTNYADRVASPSPKFEAPRPPIEEEIDYAYELDDGNLDDANITNTQVVSSEHRQQVLVDESIMQQQGDSHYVVQQRRDFNIEEEERTTVQQITSTSPGDIATEPLYDDVTTTTSAYTHTAQFETTTLEHISEPIYEDDSDDNSSDYRPEEPTSSSQFNHVNEPPESQETTLGSSPLDNASPPYSAEDEQ